MKKLSTSRCFVFLLVAAFAVQLFFASSPAHAAWEDNSDDLPGMNDFPVTLAIVGGVVVVGAVTYLIVKKSKGKKDSNSEKRENETTDQDESESTETDSPVQDTETSPKLSFDGRKESAFKLYLDIDQASDGYGYEKQKPDFSDVRVKVGVTYGF